MRLVPNPQSLSLGFEGGLPHGVLLNSIEHDPEAKPRSSRHGDRPIGVEGYRRGYQAFMLIAVAGADISRGPEGGGGGQRRHSGAAEDPHPQPATPYRNAALPGAV